MSKTETGHDGVTVQLSWEEVEDLHTFLQQFSMGDASVGDALVDQLYEALEQRKATAEAPRFAGSSAVFLSWQASDEPRVPFLLRESEEDAERYQQQILATLRQGQAITFFVEPLRVCTEHFARLVQMHDLTYSFSDDHQVWRRGQDSLDRIRAMALLLPPGEAQRIWNAQIDELWKGAAPDMEQERERWYWKEV